VVREAPLEDGIPEALLEAPLEDGIPEALLEAPLEDGIPEALLEALLEAPLEDGIPEALTEMKEEDFIHVDQQALHQQQLLKEDQVPLDHPYREENGSSLEQHVDHLLEMKEGALLLLDAN